MQSKVQPEFSKKELDPEKLLKKTLKFLKRIDYYFRLSISHPEDRENLHKLRVSIRNFIVNLNLLSVYFPSFKRKIIKSGIKILKNCTDHMRDIDVFAHYFEEIFDIKEDGVAGSNGIDAVYHNLLESKKQYYAEFYTIFYDFITYDFFRYWRSILKKHHDFTPKYQEKFHNHLVGKLKENWFNFEEKLPTNIDDEEELHQLRIAGKKFRYSFDSIKELFPEDISTEVSRIMTDIQDSLGTINDCKMVLNLLDKNNENKTSENPMVNNTIAHRYFLRLIQEKKKFFLNQRENWLANGTIEQISNIIYMT